MNKVFYDMMPDHTVSVYQEGFMPRVRSYGSLVQWCDSEFIDYELVDITDTTKAERMAIMEGYV